MGESKFANFNYADQEIYLANLINYLKLLMHT